MKRFLKAFLLSLLLCCMVSVQAFASSGTQDDLKVDVTTDKDSYQENDTIVVTIKVTNTNDTTVESVNVVDTIPKGLKIVKGPVDTSIGSLAPGESASFEFELLKGEGQPEDSDDDDEKSNLVDGTNPDGSTNGSSNGSADAGKNNAADDESKSANSVDTGDHANTFTWVILAGVSLVIIAVLVLGGKKRRSQFLSLLVCAAMLSTMLGGFTAKASEPTGDVTGDVTAVAASEDDVDGENDDADVEVLPFSKNFSVTTAIKVDGNTYNLKTQVEYTIPEAQKDLIDPDGEEIAQILNDKTGVTEEDLSIENPDDGVTSARVSYTLKEGVGAVTITDVSHSSYVGRVAGAVGAPIDINLAGDELESATITFTYDKDKLNGVNEDDLGICWYDEENHQMVLLENAVVNKENQTISVETTHFSQYVVVDTIQWYDMWAQEQLVVRNTSGNETPYYNIVFALDSSGSMSGSKMTLCKEATMEFIKLLKDRDKISVMSFASDAKVYLRNQIIGDTTLSAIQSSVSSIKATGNTNYKAGLNKALSLIIEGREQEDNSQEDISRQSLIVFLSDGSPTTNYDSSAISQLKYLAETVNCRCVTIGLGSGVKETYLKEMAAAGNGEYIYVSNASQLASVFETINNWYVGSTKDTDGDKIPDIVETTGMRTEYGFFLKTDPDDPDTDGDGIDDGEEMGIFEYADNGKSYFIINSDPTVPTYVSNQAKVTVLTKKVLIGKANLNVANATFNGIVEWFKGYRVIYSARAEKLETAWDYLSETVYADAELDVTLSQPDDCVLSKSNHYSYSPAKAGRTVSITKQNECANNLLKCKNDHDLTITTTCENGKVVDNVKLSVEDPMTKWSEVLEKKIASIEASYDSTETDFAAKSESVMDAVEEAKEEASDEKIDEIMEVVEEQLALPMTMPKEAQEAFIDCYYAQISSGLKKNFSDYKNVKTAADLVNKVSKEIEVSDGKIEFTAGGINYVCEYQITSVWGASYIQGTIEDMKTHKTYAFGGTNVNKTSIEEEMGYLKEFAELKIEEAKDAAISDAGKILEVSKIKEFIKKTTDNKLIKIINVKNPALAGKLDKLDTAVDKFIDLKKAFDKVKKIDLSSTDVDGIVKKVTGYQDSYKKFVETVTGL